MKKLFLMLLMAGVAFTACNDDPPEITLTPFQNDSYNGSSAPNFQAGTLASELVGVTLGPMQDTATLNSISFMFGGAAGTKDVLIQINRDNGTSNPLTLLYSGTHTVTASDNELVVISLKDENIEIPKGKFRVTVGLNHDGLPSVATDGVNVPIGTNWYKIKTSGTWQAASAYGITSSFIIRADVIFQEDEE